MLTNNISKSKLSGKNIGIYFGTFAPLHTGHQQQIYKCASLNDGVLLVVSGYDNDRGAQIGLPLKNVFVTCVKLLMMKKILKFRCLMKMIYQKCLMVGTNGQIVYLN